VKFKMVKKAQAALEFLTTYGWAFLVILVMIGALAYFGVLNPGSRLPEKCFVGPGFGCTGQTGDSSSNNISAKVINNYGSDVTLGTSAINVTSSSPEGVTNGDVSITGEDYGGTDVVWKANAIKEINFNFPDLKSGDRASVVFTITFDPASSDYDKTADGEITVKVI